MARELGINDTTLGNWVRAERKKGGLPATASPGDDAEMEENKRLKRRVAELEKEREIFTTRDSLLGEGVERVRVYHFIDCQKADFDVKTLCRVCEVSRSAYYDWVKNVGPDDATWSEAELAKRI